MKRMTLIALVAALTLCGCGVQTPEQATTAEQERQLKNQQSLDNPELIGQLPDGRPLYAAFVKKTGEGFTHTVYWAGNDVTMTQNSKSPVTTAKIGPPLKDIVILNGIKEDPAHVQQALTEWEDRHVRNRR